ncbi:hypothetical protein RZS08_23210, partial [Arthrospira platensis SPKY1]|nr:hypothetical protein [Arthrospira platensis SPKY1]
RAREQRRGARRFEMRAGLAAVMPQDPVDAPQGTFLQQQIELARREAVRFDVPRPKAFLERAGVRRQLIRVAAGEEEQESFAHRQNVGKHLAQGVVEGGVAIRHRRAAQVRRGGDADDQDPIGMQTSRRFLEELHGI